MYSIIKKLLFTLNPETAHSLVKSLGKIAPKDWLTRSTSVKSKYLKTTLGKVKLKNPIGLAAGFDKNGEMIPLLEALGFGFLELGSITALPCQGNPKPRIFRLTPDKSLINRMGLPNVGADAFAQHMTKTKTKIPYGVNIAKTPDFAHEGSDITPGIDDFLQSFQRVHFLGNYIVLNLSCPNTGEDKTFEDPGLFNELAREIMFSKVYLKVQKPMLIKLSPDLNHDQLKKVVEIALKYNFDGFVLTNTTTERPEMKSSQKKLEKIGNGGLSGQALSHMSQDQLKRVYEIVGKDKILMGVGGIMNFNDLLTKLAYGASLFQVYTGFVYGGPYFVKGLNKKLAALCEKLGVKSYLELVGNEEVIKMKI